MKLVKSISCVYSRKKELKKKKKKTKEFAIKQKGNVGRHTKIRAMDFTGKLRSTRKVYGVFFPNYYPFENARVYQTFRNSAPRRWWIPFIYAWKFHRCCETDCLFETLLNIEKICILNFARNTFQQNRVKFPIINRECIYIFMTVNS